jgi:1-acyl-sn-glycerol-3-phosphate acyltransferase
MMKTYLTHKILVRTSKAVLTKGITIEFKGEENLPKERAIIASNHVQVFDSVALYILLKRPIHFLVATWVFDKKVTASKTGNIVERIFGGSFLGLFLHIIQQIPVEKGNKHINEKAFKKAEEYLTKGHYIGIYPKGHFEYRKKQKVHHGVAKLAILNNAPVVPVFIKYTRIGNRDSLKPSVKKVCITIGQPIYPHLFKAKDKVKQYRSLSTTIMKRIYELQ